MFNADMTGKVALVTGATGGIGLATARLFAEAGASVMLNGRRADEIEARAQELISGWHGARTEPPDGPQRHATER